VAKEKKNKKQPKEAKALKTSRAAKPNKTNVPKRTKVVAAAKVAKTKAVDLASNPLVAEVVAAALVATAAAIKNPKTARAMAASVGDELERAGKGAQEGGNAFWQLAMDVARRSMDALAPDAGSKKAGKKAKK
jgi:hypothetical protein